MNLKHLYSFFFIVGVFFIPFNSYQGIPFLGEFRKEGAILFFLLAFFLFSIDALYKGKIHVPLKSHIFQVFCIFLLWLFVSVILNIDTVLSNYIKQTSGINRFIRQLISLGLILSVFILTYNLVLQNSVEHVFFKIRKAIAYSFLLVTLVGFVEILILKFNFYGLQNSYKWFDYLPFTETYLDTKFFRISSVSYEPPFLAIYLISISGWMFSYILTMRSSLKYIPTVLVFILTFYSASRTALIVVSIQFLVFIVTIFFYKRTYRLFLEKLLISFGIVALVAFAFNSKVVITKITEKIDSLNFKENLYDNVSNRTRFGIQYTSLVIFKENPIVGVGFGQQSYHARSLYPVWATKNNYEFKEWYLNDKDPSFPPGYNLYTRLLAETGSIGTFLFLVFIFGAMYQSNVLIKRRVNMFRTISIVLMVSFVGFFINWFQFDSFRVFGFWICLAILLGMYKKVQHE